LPLTHAVSHVAASPPAAAGHAQAVSGPA
jgi:hypothetical protein